MRLKIGIALLVLVLGCSCKIRTTDRSKSDQSVYLFTSFHEPANEGLRFLYSYDGYHWDSIPGIVLVPSIGKDSILRDPSICMGPDSIYHLVWTCSWKNDLGFGYASSKDLIHWSEEKYIPVMKDNPTSINVWAPELYYDDGEKDFIIVWATTIPFKFPKGIEDENNNHRLYYCRTKDFVTFSKAALFYDPGFSSIDATIVKRGIGNYVLVFKDNTRNERDIKVAFGKTPIGPYSEVSTSCTPKFTEGPSTLKVGNEWLIYFDAYREKHYGAVSTTDFKTFKDVTNKIKIPRKHKHGTIFTVPEKVLNKMLHQ